ncbi:hypothetical protein ACFYWP_39780 [Actinacidiphila glaucinigra]|uniref:hypothetical protein n=1 Tax=Actinacidiphila glaucinigra TaxID=235986 RepID=UPI0036D1F2B4
MTVPVDHLHGRTLYDAANAEVRFNRGTPDLIDLSDTDFAQTLAATTSHDQQPAPVTLRFAPEPARDPITLDDCTALHVLAIHAQDAAHRRRWLPGITDTELLTLHDLAFAARDAADHGSHYRTGPLDKPTSKKETARLQRRAREYHVHDGTMATAAFLRYTAATAIRLAHADNKLRPIGVTFHPAYAAGRNRWSFTNVTTRYPGGLTRTDVSHGTPTLRAVLDALTAIELPAEGDTLRLDVTDTALTYDPIPVDGIVFEDMPGRRVATELLATAAWLLPVVDPDTDAYVTQTFEHGNGWTLPSHGEPIVQTRDHVAAGIAHLHQSFPLDPPRVAIDAEGVIYASNGVRSVRFVPTRLLLDYKRGYCPGCGTPLAAAGESPCPGR